MKPRITSLALMIALSSLIFTSNVMAAQKKAEPQKSGGLVFSVGIWGGWNFPSGNELDLLQQLVDASNQTGSSNASLKKGGISAGVNFLLGNKFIRGGIGITYLQVSYAESKSNTSGISVSYSEKRQYLPVEGVLRVFPAITSNSPLAGLYLQGFGGYGFSAMVANQGINSAVQEIPNRSMGVLTYGGGLGYILDVGPIGIEFGVDLRILSASSEDRSFRAITSRLSSDYQKNTSILNITPRIGVTYTFGDVYTPPTEPEQETKKQRGRVRDDHVQAPKKVGGKAFQSGDFYLGAGLGLGVGGFGDQALSNVGVKGFAAAANAEYAFTDNFGLGGLVGYWSIPTGSSGSGASDSVGLIPLAATGAYHFNVGNPKLDFSVGAILVYYSCASCTSSGSSASSADQKTSWIGFGVFGAVRYLISDNVALRGRLGYAVTLIEVGMDFRL